MICRPSKILNHQTLDIHLGQISSKMMMRYDSYDHYTRKGIFNKKISQNEQTAYSTLANHILKSILETKLSAIIKKFLV